MTTHSERIIGLHERNAIAWDSDRGRGLVERSWLDEFISLLPPGGPVLDLGCGQESQSRDTSSSKDFQ